MLEDKQDINMAAGIVGIISRSDLRIGSEYTTRMSQRYFAT